MPSYLVALGLTLSLFALPLDWCPELQLEELCEAHLYDFTCTRSVRQRFTPELDSKGVTAQRLLIVLPLSCSPSLRRSLSVGSQAPNLDSRVKRVHSW